MRRLVGRGSLRTYCTLIAVFASPPPHISPYLPIYRGICFSPSPPAIQSCNAVRQADSLQHSTGAGALARARAAREAAKKVREANKAPVAALDRYASELESSAKQPTDGSAGDAKEGSIAKSFSTPAAKSAIARARAARAAGAAAKEGHNVDMRMTLVAEQLEAFADVVEADAAEELEAGDSQLSSSEEEVRAVKTRAAKLARARAARAAARPAREGERSKCALKLLDFAEELEEADTTGECPFILCLFLLSPFLLSPFLIRTHA